MELSRYFSKRRMLIALSMSRNSAMGAFPAPFSRWSFSNHFVGLDAADNRSITVWRSFGESSRHLAKRGLRTDSGQRVCSKKLVSIFMSVKASKTGCSNEESVVYVRRLAYWLTKIEDPFQEMPGSGHDLDKYNSANLQPVGGLAQVPVTRLLPELAPSFVRQRPMSFG